MSYKNYKPTGNNFTHAPENAHLIIETSTAIYYVSADDNKQLWKYTISSESDEQLDIDPGDAYGGDDKSRSSKIQACYHDRDTGLVWFVNCDNDGSDDTFYVFTLDTSDDTIAEVGSTTMAADIFVHDIVEIQSNTYYVCFSHNEAADTTYMYDVTAAPFTEEGSGVLFIIDDYLSPIIVLDNRYAYFTFAYSNATFLLIKWDAQLDVWSQDTSIYTHYNIVPIGYRAIAYDQDDLFYFIMQDNADSKYYLCTYSISGDSFNEKIAEYNVSLMLDRNTASGVLEKGFDTTEAKIYQISPKKAWLYHIATLNTTKTIQAITDNYVILE